MSIIVMKFGGTSVADTSCIMNVAKKVQQQFKKTKKVVVVVSAMAGTTNKLIQYIKDIDPLYIAQEHDVVVSSGEQITAGLLAVALKNLGINARSWMGWQIPILTDKIYSKHDLINSFESNIKFSNGNILVDKFLLNLGKLGAADVTGTIKTDKKYTNFKFESNVYIDNKKYFTRKFSIFSDKKIFNNLFASGTLDLVNFKMLFNEIVGDSKLREDEILYLEKEFNYYMLDNGIISFFDFNKFKEFIKTAISD